jgi:hypothetical protein
MIMEMSAWVFLFAMVAVFGFMLWRYPTGVGGDPFPYETRKRKFPWEK